MTEPAVTGASRRSSPAPATAASRTASRNRWTWRLATVAGIPIRLHFTLLLLIVWIAWMEFRAVTALHPAPRGDTIVWLFLIAGRVLFVAGLFACVLLHEIGHALAARAHAIRTTEITLYPFGGVARLHGLGTPAQELWISLSGPAVNVGIGLLLYAGLRLNGSWVTLGHLARDGTLIVQHLAIANFLLAGFNLLPAFPLDGGRVLRALLARRLGMVAGTRIAATIGQAFAIGLGLLGLIMGNFVLMFIAFFIFISAGQEVAVQHSLALMRGQTVRDAMITRFQSLPADTSLAQAADLLLSSHQQDFPVTSQGAVVAVLTRADLVRGLAKQGARADVLLAAEREVVRLAPEEPLRAAVERMQAARSNVALVFDGDALAGMLTDENIGEFFQVHAIETPAE